MTKTADLLTSLEESVAKLNITLEYDDLKKGVVNSLGGYFTHKGKERILVHKTLTPAERVEVLIGIVSEIDDLDFKALDLPDDVLKSISDQRDKREALAAKSNADLQETDRAEDDNRSHAEEPSPHH